MTITTSFASKAEEQLSNSINFGLGETASKINFVRIMPSRRCHIHIWAIFNKSNNACKLVGFGDKCGLSLALEKPSNSVFNQNCDLKFIPNIFFDQLLNS